MDIKRLIDWLPAYYKEFDSYKVGGKGLLERFLELIGTALSDVKDKIDKFLDVLSIGSTKKENLDFLAGHLGSMPFTSSSSGNPLKLTEKQRRDLISVSAWLRKNKGSKEFFVVLFNKLRNKDNNLAIEITESPIGGNKTVESTTDYDSALDSISLDINDVTGKKISTVTYKVTGTIPTSVYSYIRDILNDYSPFNVVPLVYINGKFQSKLKVPYQLSIEYFDLVSKAWKKSPAIFYVGPDTNYFRVVAYNTDTNKEVTGVRFTSKYTGDKASFTGVNKDNVLVTPYYFDIDSLPIGLNKWARTFVPELTVSSSGESVGTEVTVEFRVSKVSTTYVDNIEVVSLLDDGLTQTGNKYALSIDKYTTAAIAVRASRTEGSTKKYVSVIYNNTDSIESPTTIWYNKTTRKVLRSKPLDDKGYTKIENVSLFMVSEFTDHKFSMVLNRSKFAIVNVKEKKDATLVGKILVRQIHKSKTAWTDNLTVKISQGGVQNGDSATISIPIMEVLVLNPHIPDVWLKDGTKLTAKMICDKLQSGEGIKKLFENKDGSLQLGKAIDAVRTGHKASIDWLMEMQVGISWKLEGTPVTGKGWTYDGDEMAKPLLLLNEGTFRIVSNAHSDILPATVHFGVTTQSVLKFTHYSPLTKYIQGDNAVELSADIIIVSGNGLGFDWKSVTVSVKSPTGKVSKMVLGTQSSVTTKTDEADIQYYVNHGAYNTLKVSTKVKGTWEFTLNYNDSPAIIMFNVVSTVDDPSQLAPAFIGLLPAKDTTNSSWQTSDTSSFLEVKNLTDKCSFMVIVMNRQGKYVYYNDTITLQKPDGSTSNVDIKQPVVLDKIGEYTFKAGDIKHVLNISYKTPNVLFTIQPTSVVEGSGPLETTVTIQSNEPNHLYLASCDLGDGTNAVLMSGQQFIAPGVGTYRLQLIDNKGNIIPGKVCIFEVKPKTILPGGVSPVVTADRANIRFDNSNGNLDILLNRFRDGLYIGTGVEQDTIITNVRLQTDQAWTATLEDL
jgi:hypothetical protein|nr:MAG TPA: hypothetical protein [Caudoviricetes sp.]